MWIDNVYEGKQERKPRWVAGKDLQSSPDEFLPGILELAAEYSRATDPEERKGIARQIQHLSKAQREGRQPQGNPEPAGEPEVRE